MLNLFSITISAMGWLFEFSAFTETLVAVLILAFVSNILLFVKET